MHTFLFVRIHSFISFNIAYRHRGLDFFFLRRDKVGEDIVEREDGVKARHKGIRGAERLGGLENSRPVVTLQYISL